ncbi:hypothetical protein B566_EDAN005535 [Ephemera danica]|nr:hypothetical protein B566_EDAN005535 [Ephemera danica]
MRERHNVLQCGIHCLHSFIALLSASIADAYYLTRTIAAAGVRSYVTLAQVTPSDPVTQQIQRQLGSYDNVRHFMFEEPKRIIGVDQQVAAAQAAQQAQLHAASRSSSSSDFLVPKKPSYSSQQHNGHSASRSSSSSHHSSRYSKLPSSGGLPDPTSKAVHHQSRPPSGGSSTGGLLPTPLTSSRHNGALPNKRDPGPPPPQPRISHIAKNLPKLEDPTVHGQMELDTILKEMQELPPPLSAIITPRKEHPDASRCFSFEHAHHRITPPQPKVSREPPQLSSLQPPAPPPAAVGK